MELVSWRLAYLSPEFIDAVRTPEGDNQILSHRAAWAAFVWTPWPLRGGPRSPGKLPDAVVRAAHNVAMARMGSATPVELLSEHGRRALRAGPDELVVHGVFDPVSWRSYSDGVETWHVLDLDMRPRRVDVPAVRLSLCGEGFFDLVHDAEGEPVWLTGAARLYFPRPEPGLQLTVFANIIRSADHVRLMPHAVWVG